MTLRINERFYRCSVRRGIERASVSTRFAFLGTAVEFAQLRDGLFLVGEQRQQVTFATRVKHSTRLGYLDRW